MLGAISSTNTGSPVITEVNTMNYHERDIYGIYQNPQFAPPLMAQGPGPHLMGAETLIGNSVVNKFGQTLGDIKEIMLEVETGLVGYAVLSFSTYMGLSEKLFAVPWKMLTLDPLQKCFVLDLSPERLRIAPGFDKGHWPNMKDMAWEKSLHSFYGSNMN
jgi:sporulation protein YlmC with PRC-barrel domain